MTGRSSDVACIPTSLSEALRLRAAEPGRTVVHGGTDAMVGVNEGRSFPGSWLSLRRITELSEIVIDADTIRIGAGCSWDQLQHELVDAAPALAMAARTIGSPQIRRAGTIGGNVVTASPAADSVPPLLCYDAEVELSSLDRVRTVPLDAFATGPKTNVLAPDELVTAIRLRSLGGVEWFAKVGTRNAMVISVCSLAARLDLEHGVARVAVGSVAPTVLRVPDAEALLLDRGAATPFANAVSSAIRPIDDVRATAGYRRHAIAVLATRVHLRLWQMADGRAA